MNEPVLKYSNNKQLQTGFIYVATKDRLYYELALLSCQSLKDYYPESSVTLFTHEDFLDERSKLFDNVYVNIPIHTRAKMWCMARTPYDRTIYIDCDSIIRHKDIKIMHDFLDECDLFCGSNLQYTVSNFKWAFIDKDWTFNIEYHGSMWGYHKNEKCLDFMQTWFDEYIKQINSDWTYDKYHKEWQQFDMFTLWRMTSKKFDEFKRFDDLNIKILPRRFNITAQDIIKEVQGKPVIQQIDKSTYKMMPNVWKFLMKGAKDEKYTIKQRSIDKASIEYN